MVRIALGLLVAVLVFPTAGSARTTACLTGDQQARLVSYSRTGGFIGINDRLTVRRSGAATLVRSRSAGSTFRVGCIRLRALAAALERARFASLAPVYAPDDPFADGFIETIGYRGQTVRVLTGASPPPRLARVLGLLREIAGTRE